MIMKHFLEARRLKVVNKLERVNHAIAAEQKRISQIEAKLAMLTLRAMAA
jgi:uncharacterized coiled-coil protein SlyX